MNANLTVTVLDCNDNGPVFINAPPYEFTVNETSATHARIEVFTMVDTTDADGTMANRAVVYSITGSQWFEIDRDTVSLNSIDTSSYQIHREEKIFPDCWGKSQLDGIMI